MIGLVNVIRLKLESKCGKKTSNLYLEKWKYCDEF